MDFINEFPAVSSKLEVTLQKHFLPIFQKNGI